MWAGAVLADWKPVLPEDYRPVEVPGPLVILFQGDYRYEYTPQFAQISTSVSGDLGWVVVEKRRRDRSWLLLGVLVGLTIASGLMTALEVI